MLAAISFLQKQQRTGYIVGGAETQQMADQLRAAKVPLVYQPRNRFHSPGSDIGRDPDDGYENLFAGGASGDQQSALAARVIHLHSRRHAAPFITLACASLPETLLEAESFGHEKGAFTGADQKKAGLFESANGGTLFLDEIGDLPLELQPKLLRALQEQEFEPVGGVT